MTKAKIYYHDIGDYLSRFWVFSKAGRALADLHLNYENISAHPDVRETQSDPFEHGQSAVTTHKDGGITNNPNDWACENRNPRYIIDLLHSVINLSVQTVGIVKNLPDVEFRSEENE